MQRALKRVGGDRSEGEAVMRTHVLGTAKGFEIRRGERRCDVQQPRTHPETVMET